MMVLRGGGHNFSEVAFRADFGKFPRKSDKT